MSAQYIPPPSLPLSGSPPNMIGPIYGNNGSAPAPGYAFASDNTTGFFRQAASRIGVSVGGTESFRFGLSSGSVPRFSYGNLIDDTINAAACFISLVTGGTANNFVIGSEGNAVFILEQFANATTTPNLTLGKGRGTIAAATPIALNDPFGQINYRGQNISSGTATFTTGAQIQGKCIETGTVSPTAMGGQITFSQCPIGSGTLTEVMRLETATGLSMFGANPVIDANRVFRKRVFTFATLPTGVDGMASFISDSSVTTFATDAAGGGANHVPVYFSSGTSTWKVG